MAAKACPDVLDERNAIGFAAGIRSPIRSRLSVPDRGNRRCLPALKTAVAPDVEGEGITEPHRTSEPPIGACRLYRGQRRVQYNEVASGAMPFCLFFPRSRIGLAACPLSLVMLGYEGGFSRGSSPLQPRDGIDIEYGYDEDQGQGGGMAHHYLPPLSMRCSLLLFPLRSSRRPFDRRRCKIE